MSKTLQNKVKLDWVDALKAFAILGILLNHFVELYGVGPWFSNPSYNWPDLNVRLQSIFPQGNSFALNAIQFVGWLGDMGPGVFILLSGFTLALSQSKKKYSLKQFYAKRALRIFPLYIVIHIIILAFLFFIDESFELNKSKLLLSITGLRLTDELFFYLNPSWWFIWLIIQLYVIFPFLNKLLNWNKRNFILITLAFTVLSRLAGLLDFTYSNNLYYWMTGLFFGTRLFEFAIGMLFGVLYYQKSPVITNILAAKSRTFLYATLVYLLGFSLSLFYWGTLFSNMLITIGLSGMFYSLYSNINGVVVRKLICKIGVLSFPVFLLHQPIMRFILESNSTGFSAIYNVIFIVLCFPIGYVINMIVEKGISIFNLRKKVFKDYISNRNRRILFLVFLLGIMLFNFVYSTFGLPDAFNKVLLLLGFILLLSYHILESDFLSKKRLSFILLLLVLYIIFLIILPYQWIQVLSIVCIPGIVLLIINYRLNFNIRVVLFNIIFLFIIIAISEIYFRTNRPIELGKWGEYPALQIDDQTVYSLIPNKNTRLTYNNYDYIVSTNSLGFNSPEIDLSLPKDTSTYRIFIVGDAFSMPEGMEYELAYPYLLEKKLEKQYPGKTIQVINGGVTGYGPNEMFLQIEKYIDIVNPDLIVNQIFVNEFLEINISESERRAEIGFKETKGMEEILGFSQLSIQMDRLLRKIFRINNTVSRYNKSLLYLYEKNSVFHNDENISRLSSYFYRIKEIVDTKGCNLLVLYVPGKIEVSSPDHMDYYPVEINIKDTSRFDFQKPNRLIQDLCLSNNISFFDSENTLKEHWNQPVYFPGSWHWNQEGHHVISEALSLIINPN